MFDLIKKLVIIRHKWTSDVEYENIISVFYDEIKKQCFKKQDKEISTFWLCL